MQHAVHELQTFLAVQRLCLNPKPFEVIEKLDFNLLQSHLCSTDAFSFNREGDVLAALQGIVPLHHLLQQYGRKLIPHMIETIILMRNDQRFLKLSLVDLCIHEAQLHMHIRLEEIQDSAPTTEDGLTIFLLRLSIVDIMKTDRFGITGFRHLTQTIRKHPKIRNSLLGSLRVFGFPCLRHDQFQLFFLSSGQFDLGTTLVFFGPEQYGLPPFQVLPAEQAQYRHCRFGKAVSWNG